MIFMPVWLCWTIYFTVGLPLVAMDYSRRHSPAFNRFTLKILGPVFRKHEIRKLSGSSYAILGVGLCFFLFPKPTSLLAVLFLAVGDPVASFFGLRFGRTKIIDNKSMYGSAAAFVFCSVAAFIFISLYPKSMGADGWLELYGLSLACGAIGAISELVSFFSIDDNLTQPVVSGALLSLLFLQVGGVTFG